MTISYLLRHGRTALSARYIADGSTARSVSLDEVGRIQAGNLARCGWTPEISTCVVTRLVRTHETARLILGQRHDLTIEPRLDEIRYGQFDGGPWMAYGEWLRRHGVNARPAGGESRTEAHRRILHGLRATLALPGPRLVVGHGLMISMLMQLMRSGPLDHLQLPEAPYARPLPLADAQLHDLLETGLGHLGRTTPATVAGSPRLLH